jgi:chitinase
MMKLKIWYLFLLLLIYFNISTAQTPFKVIGYLPTWAGYPNSVNNLQFSKLTHINIAFANPDAGGNLIPEDGTTNANVTTVVNTAHTNNLKVFLSIGGAGAPGNTYKNLLSNTTNINNFVTNIVNYAVTYNLDGIDVDIEGDVLDGTTLTAAKYESFVTALAAALHAQNKEMSAALAQWFGNYITTTAAAQFDWINIMSYDAAIPGSGDPQGQHSPYSLVDNDFQYWNSTKGVAGSKLVVGVPFYGYGWGTKAVANNNEISYCSIVTQYSGAENSNQVGSGSNVIYYNGIPLIQKKTSYALQNASGIMIWQITEDCNNSKSLLSAIDATVQTVTTIKTGNDSSPLYEVFPNPFELGTIIKCNSSINPIFIEVTDIQGAVVQKEIIPVGLDQTTIGTSLRPGIYFLKISESDRISYMKIVKK